MRKLKWVEPFSSKHNLAAKVLKEQINKARIKRKSKPKLTFGQKIKRKLLVVSFFFYWLFKEIKK